MTKIDVLDHGYVRLVKHMGDDLDVVNSAKVSFAKESLTFDEKARNIEQQLADGGHTSPLRHSVITLEFKAPLFVRNQIWRYVVGGIHQPMDPLFAWNEASRRYMTRTPEFYLPEVWRAAPEERRQGSAGEVSPDVAFAADTELTDIFRSGLDAYKRAMANGICAEQARLFLPAYAMYTTWRWTGSLQSYLHFLAQRMDDAAQWECQQYAEAVIQIIEPLFPATFVCFDFETFR